MRVSKCKGLHWTDGSSLINDPPELITHLATERFIECMQAARHNGYGFVPFIGAGFSAPSGAPLVMEIESYLQRCICMALGAEVAKMEAWAPRTDQWPPFIDRVRTKDTNYDSNHWLRLISEMMHNLKISDHKFDLLAQGLGAAAEWRAALSFLSRVVHPTRRASNEHSDPIMLGAPRQEIIDSCLREVLKDKHPALGHKMLAVLAGALRLDLVLTTNFDDLLERAFAEARNPLEVFEVHLGSSLPHWSAVSDIRSLIKLHGNRYSLRADYSLDELPSDTDKQRFLGYLLSGQGRSKLADDPYEIDLDFQNHLLVMGFSVSDRRTCEFVKYAWQHLREDFKVFWLCYSTSDVAQVQQLTAEFVNNKNLNTGRHDGQHSIILRHTDFGFFLLQLYQTVRRNLPPLGGIFPSVSRLTFPPMASVAITKHRESRSENSFCAEIRKHLEDFKPESEYRGFRLLVATSEDNVGGVTSACSEIYREMEANNICVWMDMNDISSTDNLFEVLLEAANFRLGSENWTPVYIASDNRPRVSEISHLAHSVAKPWIIFLNARETPGVNTTDERDFRPNSNGWLDISESNSQGVADPSACKEKFLDLLFELCGETSKAISVVLICRDSSTDPSPLIKELGQLGGPSSVRIVKLRHDSKERIDFSKEEIAAQAIAWTAGDKRKRRFLQALILMQRPRLLATIWSTAASLTGNESAETLDDREKWVTALEKCGLLRRKAGGFIWIHSLCRQSIREKLESRQEQDDFLEKFPKAKAAWGDWEPKIDEPEIHVKLAEWYEKVLEASEFPAAVFEAVYHLCRAAEITLELDKDQIQVACDRLEAAASLLKANSFLIQTHGYSRGSCRHLEYIRDTLCKAVQENVPQIPEPLFNAIHRLQIVCTEVMRMVAREVGEDAKLYLRHRQFGVLLAGDEWTLEHERKFKEEQTFHISEEIYRNLSASEALSSGNNFQQMAGGTYINSPNSEWLRWWRWCGMLGIASRSYHVAESAVSKALRYARETPTEEIEWDRLIQGDFMIFGKRPHKSQLQSLRIEVLRSMEQYVYLLLLEDSPANRLRALTEVGEFRSARDMKFEPPEKMLERIEMIESYIAYARELASKIRSKDHSSDSHYTVQANWCEVRLLMHSSVCASMRVRFGFNNDHANLHSAMALLGDAEAGLRVSDPRRNRSELAMIELHRADARLRHAEAVQIYEDVENTPMSFAKMCRVLELEEYRDRQSHQNESLRDKFLGERRQWEDCVNKTLRRAKSLVADSMRFLNRAEPVLRARRRNVWWTTWFFERRLRAIAMSVWASVFEIDTPIPFLGLEAAMRKTDTVADTILKDAIRMIRVDAYRLATIVDAYASCAKALQARMILDSSSIILEQRQGDMQAELNAALKALEDVNERRNSLLADKWEKDGRMDDNVQTYVDVVQERTSRIARNYRLIIY